MRNNMGRHIGTKTRHGEKQRRKAKAVGTKVGHGEMETGMTTVGKDMITEQNVGEVTEVGKAVRRNVGKEMNETRRM